MMKNPAIAEKELGESVVVEVRAIREAIDQAAGHDVRRLAEQARCTSEAVRREYRMKVAQLPTGLVARHPASPA